MNLNDLVFEKRDTLHGLMRLKKNEDFHYFMSFIMEARERINSDILSRCKHDVDMNSSAIKMLVSDDEAWRRIENFFHGLDKAVEKVDKLKEEAERKESSPK